MITPRVTIRRTSPRYVAWLHVFGDSCRTPEGISVPVLSAVPARGAAPGQHSAEFYKLDVSQLSSVQRERLLDHVARTFHMARAEALELLNNPQHGLPILADEHVIAPGMDLRHFV